MGQVLVTFLIENYHQLVTDPWPRTYLSNTWPTGDQFLTSTTPCRLWPTGDQHYCYYCSWNQQVWDLSRDAVMDSVVVPGVCSRVVLLLLNYQNLFQQHLNHGLGRCRCHADNRATPMTCRRRLWTRPWCIWHPVVSGQGRCIASRGKLLSLTTARPRPVWLVFIFTYLYNWPCLLSPGKVGWL